MAVLLCYASSSTWRAGFVTAAVGGNKNVEVQKPNKSSSSSGPKLKMHRTWTPGVRMSKERFLLKELEDEKAETGDPLERKALRKNRAVSSEDESGFSEESDEEDESEVEEEDDEVEPTSELNCRHFSRCSGCAYENGLNNPPAYEDAVEFFQQRHIDNLELIPSPTRGWRCRAKLAVRGTPEKPYIGLFEENSHNIVDVPSCRVHHPAINTAVELIKAVIKDIGVEPYEEDTYTGYLRYIQLVVTTYDTSLPSELRRGAAKVQVSLVWNTAHEKCPESENLLEMARALWKLGGPDSKMNILHSVWANFQTAQSNIILGHRWRRLHGPEFLWERVGGADICFPPSSFGQANYKVFGKLLSKLQKYVRRYSAVADLYAGGGVIGLSLLMTRDCRRVKCVEVNTHSKIGFEQSVSRLPERLKDRITWHCADACESPIKWLKGSEVVIVDPPRKGLDTKVIEALRTASVRARNVAPGTQQLTMRSPKKPERRPWKVSAQTNEEDSYIVSEGEVWPDRLIYVSCGWQSFKRDCKALEEGGYWHLARAHAYVFFPGNDSVEILAVFLAGKRDKRREKKEARKLARRPAERRP